MHDMANFKMGPAKDTTGSVGRATEIGTDAVGEMLSWTGDGGVPSTIAEPHFQSSHAKSSLKKTQRQ